MALPARVVVTGMGVVSSIGIGKDEFWENVVLGKSGISDVEIFNTSNFSVKRAGEVKNFNPKKFIDGDFCEKIGRGSQLAIAATKMALEDGGLCGEKDAVRNTGIIIGSTMGEAPSIEVIDRYWTSKGEEDVYPSTVAKFPVNNLSHNVGYYFGFVRENYVIPTACAAGNYSIGYAFDLIRLGKNNIVLAGGADPLSRLAFTGFNRLFAMSPDKCQPFDKNRKGMMVGEGSAILVIESLESAQKRNAKIYAEILGYGLSCDAFNMAIPSEEGIGKVMEKAIKNSGIRKEEVDYISAHGTGTVLNDKTEVLAIKNVFRDEAEKILVSSIKSMVGHTMGTASGLEAIVCCLSIQDNIVPPTINYETPDEECAIDCVPNQAREKEINVALNNSFAFGGNNACLVFKRYES